MEAFWTDFRLWKRFKINSNVAMCEMNAEMKCTEVLTLQDKRIIFISVLMTFYFFKIRLCFVVAQFLF